MRALMTASSPLEDSTAVQLIALSAILFALAAATGRLSPTGPLAVGVAHLAGSTVLLLFGWPAGMPTSPYLTSVLTMGLGVSLGATLAGIGLGARPRSERRGAGAVIVGIIALLAGTAVTAAGGSSAIRQVDLVEPAAVAPLGMMLAGAALTVVGASTVRRSPGALIVVGTVLLVVSGATMVGSPDVARVLMQVEPASIEWLGSGLIAVIGATMLGGGLGLAGRQGERASSGDEAPGLGDRVAERLGDRAAIDPARSGTVGKYPSPNAPMPGTTSMPLPGTTNTTGPGRPAGRRRDG